jgi:hypothetical protein
MAEIEIERRKRSPLPWIIGLVVLALVAFFLLRGRGAEETEAVAPPTLATDSAASPAP